MKIVVVRGPSLNSWEMQNYLPLAKKNELLLIGSKKGAYEMNSGKKVKKLICLGELFNYFPGGIKLLYSFLGDPQLILGLEKAMAGHDIVHTAEAANYYSLQAVRARQKGLVGRVAVTCWENLPFNRENYPAQKRLKKEVRQGADHFLAVTQGAKEALIKEGVVENKITVIPMGIDLKKFKYQNLNIKNKKGKFKILFVGRLEEEKGIWELLRAFKNLRKKFNDCQLIIIGQGSQEKKIRNWLLDNKLIYYTRLKKGVDYEEMGQEYHKADILVLPSKPTPTWQEQFGMVLIESMASGLPIVASKSGAIPEVVGKAGLLVEPGNAFALAQAIEKLIKSSQLRNQLALRGRKRAQERYDCQKVAARIEKLYEGALKD